jgi:hypothetical protein
VLTTPHKTEVDNYLNPATRDALTYPNSDSLAVFHEKIPADTVPGIYILSVIQKKQGDDAKGIEIYRKTITIRQSTSYHGAVR